MKKIFNLVNRNQFKGKNMSETINGKDMHQIIKNIADKMEKNKKYLTTLDSPIGDADHGINMNRGFKSALEKLEEDNNKTPSEVLKTTGTALMGVVGGAAGPLYGQFFMQAGGALSGEDSIDKEGYKKLISAALDGVVGIGEAETGQKTMVDTLTPASSKLEEEVDSESSFSEAAIEAAEAGREGMKGTVPMEAEKGRASYLGERSIGYQDPGATSTYIILQEYANYIREECTDYEVPEPEEEAKELENECKNFETGICGILKDVCPVNGDVMDSDCLVYKTLAKERD